MYIRYKYMQTIYTHIHYRMCIYVCVYMNTDIYTNMYVCIFICVLLFRN